MGARQLPADEDGFGEHVAQEAEPRDDDSVAELIWLDVDQGHSEHVAALGALDVNRSGHGMNEIEVQRRDIVGIGVEGEVGVECVPRLEDDEVARSGSRRPLDRRVVPVEAVRIVRAVVPILLNHDPVLPGHIARVGVSGNRDPDPRQKCDRPHGAHGSPPRRKSQCPNAGSFLSGFSGLSRRARIEAEHAWQGEGAVEPGVIITVRPPHRPISESGS